MASIYENAFLNICAEYSPGVHTGIFSEPTEPDHLLGTFDGTSVYIRLNPHGWKSYELNPLQDRGWTFQEQHSAMEFHNDEQDPVEKWHRVVSDYAMRKLTYDSDKLPAISGIAKRCLAFRDSDDEYLAGLWRKSLLADLTWCYHDEFYNKQGYADIPYVYCAPSWSWASVVATVTPCFTWSLGSTTRSGEPYRPLCDIHDAKCTLKGLDPMGEVSDGSIDISGPILRATITSNDAESYDFTVNDMEDGLYKELFAPDCFEDKEPPGVDALRRMD
ncbi:hypothetical protein CkaCkLH20_04804 [Colletotrichum karsti]|uniref:Uncharacterized protein n=1 Tax=Colletotrichum karsti TaxID=1095194 RepID=A0A9P6I7I8_9PEZI|nr:uncharacterized protein CkaCkLH20_04804 [Colletotrichum karsti]KAF9877669.1 hypothetical protein CkaCkLH20_04804 [Colletotrichum karsti]